MKLVAKRQYLYLILFCLFCFFISDFTRIRGGGCDISPCRTKGDDQFYLESSSILPLAPASVFHAQLIRFFVKDISLHERSGFIYYLESDIYASSNQALLQKTYVVEKILHLLNLPWWILLFYFLIRFVHRMEKRKLLIFKIISALFLYFLLFYHFSVLRDYLFPTGEANMTMQFFFGIPDDTIEVPLKLFLLLFFMPIYGLFWILSLFR